MNIKVAAQTVREACQDLLLVRRRVALYALGNVFMLGVMACGTVDLAMFTAGLLPCGISFLVAGAAGSCRRVLRIGDLERIVDRMALDAGRNILALIVRFVTGGAVRNIAMRSVACGAGNLGIVLAQ